MKEACSRINVFESVTEQEREEFGRYRGSPIVEITAAMNGQLGSAMQKLSVNVTAAREEVMYAAYYAASAHDSIQRDLDERAEAVYLERMREYEEKKKAFLEVTGKEEEETNSLNPDS